MIDFDKFFDFVNNIICIEYINGMTVINSTDGIIRYDHFNRKVKFSLYSFNSNLFELIYDPDMDWLVYCTNTSDMYDKINRTYIKQISTKTNDYINEVQLKSLKLFKENSAMDAAIIRIKNGQI